MLCCEIIMPERGELAHTHMSKGAAGWLGAWQGHTLERKTLPKMRSKCAGVLRDWALISLSPYMLILYIFAYIWTKDSRMCRCRGIVLYIFTIFIFVLTHTQTQARVNSSSSICLFVYLPVSCGWWINFCLYSSHETQTEKRTEIKRSRITFAWNQRQSNAQDTRDTGPEKPKTGHRHRDPVKASHPQQVSSLSVILPANTSDEQCQCASFDCKVTRFTGDVLIACPG